MTPEQNAALNGFGRAVTDAQVLIRASAWAVAAGEEDGGGDPGAYAAYIADILLAKAADDLEQVEIGLLRLRTDLG